MDKLKFRCPACNAELIDKRTTWICPNEHGPFSLNALGIVEFLQTQDDYFSSHWKDNNLPEIAESKMQVGSNFLKLLLAKEAGTWLDVGAGDGVHLYLLNEAVPQAVLVGMDVSPSGLEICRRRVPDAHLLLANGQNIPIVDDAVDASFSYGVLGYMPEPWSGLAEMVRVTRPGGLIGLWMYPKNTTFLGLLFSVTRAIVPSLPHFVQARIADLIVPFLGILPTAGKLHLGNASWKACREVVLVNIAPDRLYFPTELEIKERLEDLGCKILSSDPNAPYTFWAIKE